MRLELTALKDDRLPVMVASHERSGTHFTMNALDVCFGYIARPWVDFDYKPFNINYYSADNVRSLLLQLADGKVAHTIKSHHEFAFLADVIGDLEGRMQIVYVHRNPADTSCRLTIGVRNSERPGRGVVLAIGKMAL